MNIIILFYFFFIFSIFPFQIIGPKGWNIIKKNIKNKNIYREPEPKHLIKINDAKKITIKIIEDIKAYLYLNQQPRLLNDVEFLNYFVNVFKSNQKNYLEQIKEKEPFLNENLNVEVPPPTIYSLLINHEDIIKEYCNGILEISGEGSSNRGRDIIKERENFNASNLCKIGFMFGFAKFFVKFFLEELNKNGYSSENEENEIEKINWGNWVKETEEFLNNCYIIWEKTRHIDNAESAKIKTKKSKKSKNKFEVLNLEEIKKEIKNKYEIKEINEFD